ncbi:hypothetical protein EVAR_50603_1 [Eumeta japonica]|uniref:Uncharacterized protein n=1 Tax=Eumeta variegata TaxID=151549 RepID=A0A4C1Y8A2_EUMVA|nr:hypothetical protein EVAR_50603_1 [Eumeta japonica]
MVSTWVSASYYYLQGVGARRETHDDAGAPARGTMLSGAGAAADRGPRGLLLVRPEKRNAFADGNASRLQLRQTVGSPRWPRAGRAVPITVVSDAMTTPGPDSLTCPLRHGASGFRMT